MAKSVSHISTNWRDSKRGLSFKINGTEKVSLRAIETSLYFSEAQSQGGLYEISCLEAL